MEQGGIGSVLRRNQLFVPPNQRDYSWQEEVLELYRDLAGAMAEDRDYFLGTIVTIPREGGASLEVVDGQQRLATTSLLLTAIRDYYRTIDEPVRADAITSDFLAGFDRARRERTSRLKLNVVDNDLFGALLADDPQRELPKAKDVTKPSNRRLLSAFGEAKRQISNVVSSVDPKDHGDVLERLTSFVEHRANVVLLKVPNDADAYTMFETLNDRGLRTSQADLVKNLLFGNARDRLPEVQDRWSLMRGALESLGDDEITITFVRYVLVLLRGYLHSPAAAYEAVQHIARPGQLTVTFAGNLASLAPVYVATFNADHERWNEYPATVRSAIRTLNLLDLKPMQPLVLAVATKLSKKEAATSLSFLVALGVRLIVATTVRSGSVERPLAEAARAVYAGGITTSQGLKDALG
ncbi:MAG: DUF262 domain-containing protein, partial [Nitrososphaerales archaeon]